MNDPLEALQSDISFLKALALEGRAAPPLGGSILVAAGCVYGVASLLHWAIQTGKLPVSPWAYAVVWSAATVIFMAVMLVIFRRLRPMKAQSAGNRAIGLAWQGVGWTIFTLVASAFLVAWRIDSPIPTCSSRPSYLACMVWAGAWRRPFPAKAGSG